MGWLRMAIRAARATMAKGDNDAPSRFLNSSLYWPLAVIKAVTSASWTVVSWAASRWDSFILAAMR